MAVHAVWRLILLALWLGAHPAWVLGRLHVPALARIMAITHRKGVHPVAPVMVSHGAGPTCTLRVGWRRVLGLWPGNAAAHRWPVPLVGSNHILAAIRRVSVPLLHIWISRIVSHRSVHIWRLKCRCIVLLLSL